MGSTTAQDQQEELEKKLLEKSERTVKETLQEQRCCKCTWWSKIGFASLVFICLLILAGGGVTFMQPYSVNIDCHTMDKRGCDPSDHNEHEYYYLLVLEGGRTGPHKIHGLWPEYYQGFPCCCTGDRQTLTRRGVKTVLQTGSDQLRNDMVRLWKSNNGDNYGFWAHEYNKHGTCALSLSPDPIDYFQKTINLAKEQFNALTTFLERFQGNTWTPEQIREAGEGKISIANLKCSDDCRLLQRYDFCYEVDLTLMNHCPTHTDVIGEESCLKCERVSYLFF